MSRTKPRPLRSVLAQFRRHCDEQLAQITRLEMEANQLERQAHENRRSAQERRATLERLLNGVGTPPAAPRPETPQRTGRQRSLSAFHGVVLRAIAHYERHAPHSLIDGKAIRIRLNSEDPDLLDRYNKNMVAIALYDLRAHGLVERLPSGRGQRASQYHLTAPGKRFLTRHPEEERSGRHA